MLNHCPLALRRALHRKPISELRSVTCHMESHCCLPPDTGKCLNLWEPGRPVLDLPTPEGWKAELTLVVESWNYKPVDKNHC